MTRAARWFLIGLVLVACLGARVETSGPDLRLTLEREQRTSELPRIVAVGDVHGDFDALASILELARLIDPQHRWIGGDSILVQTGDILDRGPKSRKVMDLLMALEKEARQHKGRVVVLLGNHELMNLYGDLRYVAPEDYAGFADAGSEKRRQEAYKSHLAALKQIAGIVRQPAPAASSESEKRWKDQRPLGFIEHRAAFGPEGKYGRWLRGKSVIHEEQGVLFLHGGISPSTGALKTGQINARVKGEIQIFDSTLKSLVELGIALPSHTLDELTATVQSVFDAAAKGSLSLPLDVDPGQQIRSLDGFAGMRSWLAIHPDGPVWHRGFAEWNEEEGIRNLDALARFYSDVRFVVGHTVQTDGRIRPRFGGRVFLIDTGMLSSYYSGGRPSALEIAGGRFTALYADQQTVLLDSKVSGAR